MLIGGAGGDRLVGGTNVDRADYSTSEGRIGIVLDNGIRRGEAACGRLGSIEEVTGLAFGDLVRGSNATSRIETNADDDVVDGLGGDDVLNGGGS